LAAFLRIRCCLVDVVTDGGGGGGVAKQPVWWKRGIVYQVYPRSFLDSDGDGTGDLPGVTRKLDYLHWLGVDAVWLSPFYPSPMADFGYDVADYCDVDPLFGTLDDFDALVREAHARGLKVLVDFVPNHTSDQHAWFRESRASRDNPKRDWYLWADPAPDGGEPNNWLAAFGGSGWELDEATGQYYFHRFLKEQPDLNWRNPAVRRAMWDVLRFWMERGVDGFRVDVIWLMSKDEELRDDPVNPDYKPGDPEWNRVIATYSGGGGQIHEIVREMRQTIDEYPERVLIGEIYAPVEEMVSFYGENLDECHLPFNFHLVTSPWAARDFADFIAEYERMVPQGGWPNWVLGNHDRPRIASRVGAERVRVAAMLLLTLRGTPTMYYGDEIGMQDVPIPPDRLVDPAGAVNPAMNRDPQRTPMQWDASEQAGFTTGQPWLPIAEDAVMVNVAAQRDDPTAMLSFYRRLIALRQDEPALEIGDYMAVEAEGDVLAYLRRHGDRQILVALNLGGSSAQLDLATTGLGGEVVISTEGDREGESIAGTVALRPHEGVIVAS
jgi:alpha-glucosidase